MAINLMARSTIAMRISLTKNLMMSTVLTARLWKQRQSTLLRWEHQLTWTCVVSSTRTNLTMNLTLTA
jgi:hypothetical protein